MNRLAWIAIVVLAGITSLVVGDLLDPESVPVARAVELTGTAPTDRPSPEGYFIVPPRVVDFRDDPDDSDDNGDSSESSEPSVTENAVDDSSQSPDDSDDDQDDDDPDDSPDDLDDEDDNVDDDD